jgi:hypothetical protein
MPRVVRFIVMCLVCAITIGTAPIVAWFVVPADPSDPRSGAALRTLAPLAISVDAMVSATALPATVALTALIFALTKLLSRRTPLCPVGAALASALIVGGAGAGVAALCWPNALAAMSAPFQSGPFVPLIGGLIAGVLLAPWATGTARCHSAGCDGP